MRDITELLDKTEGKHRVMTGMRSTGKLHLGHLVAVLRPYLELQETSSSEDTLEKPSFMIADVHTMTTSNTKEDFKNAERRTLDFTKELLSAGIDPEKSTLYAQSTVPEHYEIGYLLTNFVTASRLERNPTLKDWKDKQKSPSASLFLYPVLQAGDILANDGTIVPVGRDQMPHLEISREIARKVNDVAGYDLFRVPQGLEILDGVLIGTDGKKMGKSFGNTIDLGEGDKSYAKKIRKMPTDPEKIESRGYVGNPESCSVYEYQKLFNDEASSIEKRCIEGDLLCGYCKSDLVKALNPTLETFRKKRESISDDRAYDVLRKGRDEVREIASEKLRELRDVVGINYKI